MSKNKSGSKNVNSHQQRTNGSSRGIGNIPNPSRESNAFRIGWNSNAPFANTGYGTQTAQVISRLKAQGNQVAVFNNYGLEGTNSEWNGIPIYQRGADLYSNDVVPAHMFHWASQNPKAPNVLITLYDVWVFKGQRWSDWNVASWVPIDHVPAPPQVASWCRQDFVTPLAMSQYGQDILANVGIDSLYIPHAIEDVFRPTKYVDGVSGRKFIGIPDDKFVVGMNAANKGVSPNRKAFGENLLAFSIFAKQHNDVVLYLHTDYLGHLGGIKLDQLVKSCGIPEEKLKFIDPYVYKSGIDQKRLASIYTAMDVLLATSYGEGFGIPTIEAQACGTPVIVSEFAASTELCGDGWLIDGQPLWDAPQSSWFHMPSVPKIVEALEDAYQRDRERSLKAIEFARAYNADTVFEKYWIPALEVLKSRSKGVPTS
jgi:glycosyltransferase involved in cell wall biosynthesis